MVDLTDEERDMKPLFETILSYIPAPQGDPEADTQVLISTIDYNEYVGRIGLGKLDNESAGIVGSHVKAEGVVLSRENIANETKNFTRFLRLVRRVEQPEVPSKMIFICAVCEHKPGTLTRLLQIFADYGYNLTRIESRPIKNVFGEYRFFMELEGNIAAADVKEMLARAQEYCRQFRILGAYN